jgi:hypothetical protein
MAVQLAASEEALSSISKVKVTPVQNVHIYEQQILRQFSDYSHSVWVNRHIQTEQ